MTGRPQPERRYEDDDRQRAYEQGWQQCWDHDSFRVLDWMNTPSTEVATGLLPTKRRGANCARRCSKAARPHCSNSPTASASAVLWEAPTS